MIILHINMIVMHNIDELFEKKHIGHDIFYIRHSYFDQVSHYFEVERIEDFMYDEILSFLLVK